MGTNISFHKSILETTREANWRITDEELGSLVAHKGASDAVSDALGDDYFRVLLRRTKDTVANESKTPIDAVESVGQAMLDVVNSKLITPDIAPNKADSKEEKARKTKIRQSKTVFARTAKRTLKAYIERGGDLDALDPKTCGKNVVSNMADALVEDADDGTTTSDKSTAERARSRLNALLKTLRDMKGEDATAFEAFRAECVSEILSL